MTSYTVTISDNDSGVILNNIVVVNNNRVIRVTIIIIIFNLVIFTIVIIINNVIFIAMQLLLEICSGFNFRCVQTLNLNLPYLWYEF